MMNVVAAVGAAAICAGVSVGLFSPAGHNAAASQAVAAKSVQLSAPLVTAVAPPVEAATPSPDVSCTQGWPYYPAACLRSGKETKAPAVRVIAVDRAAQAATAQARVAQAHTVKAPPAPIRMVQNRGTASLRTAQAQ
jgi:hypothetical protein